jgi:thiazolylpeptide-type bacteriocin precursor
MNDIRDLATLIDELQALESETFEVRDYADSTDLLVFETCSSSSTSSTTSSTCA